MSANVRYRHHATYGDQCAHCVEEEIREDMESALAEARNKALEEAAKICESMVVGGRAWTHEQSVAGEALFEAAKALRAAGEKKA